MGVTLIVNHRPDGEEPGQPLGAEIEDATSAAGIDYRAIPIIRGIGPADAEATREALDSASGKTLMFCRSGNRSALAWALAQIARRALLEEIEATLEEIDTRAMSGTVDERDDVLGRLVETRREIGRLRRALTSHREAILALTRPELEAIASSSSAARFSELRQRLEEAVQAARDSREAVVGAFDVVIASTGQRTNDIMKILTLASVLVLPAALIAGVMGMNFKLGVFQTTAYFWVVIAVMVVIAIVTLALARMRDWI